LKYYKDDGKERFRDREVTLENALLELDNLPSIEEYDRNFIGFTKSREETVQFIRNEKENWLIDRPVFENGKFTHSFHDDKLATGKVKEIVKRFFSGQDWQSLVNLRRY
jgi:hypothetical protein